MVPGDRRNKRYRHWRGRSIASYKAGRMGGQKLAWQAVYSYGGPNPQTVKRARKKSKKNRKEGPPIKWSIKLRKGKKGRKSFYLHGAEGQTGPESQERKSVTRLLHNSEYQVTEEKRRRVLNGINDDISGGIGEGDACFNIIQVRGASRQERETVEKNRNGEYVANRRANERQSYTGRS